MNALNGHDIEDLNEKLRRSQQLEDRLVTDAFLHRAYQTLIRNHLEGNPDLLLVSRTFRRR